MVVVSALGIFVEAGVGWRMDFKSFRDKQKDIKKPLGFFVFDTKNSNRYMKESVRVVSLLVQY